MLNAFYLHKYSQCTFSGFWKENKEKKREREKDKAVSAGSDACWLFAVCLSWREFRKRRTILTVKPAGWLRDSSLHPGCCCRWDTFSITASSALSVSCITEFLPASGCFARSSDACVWYEAQARRRRLRPSPSVCLVDVMDRQLECGREGLWHGVGGVSSIRCSCSCNRCVLLQGGQSCRVGSIVCCNGDVAGAIQAASGWQTLDVMGHGIDGGDGTTLAGGRQRERERKRESIVGCDGSSWNTGESATFQKNGRMRKCSLNSPGTVEGWRRQGGQWQQRWCWSAHVASSEGWSGAPPRAPCPPPSAWLQAERWRQGTGRPEPAEPLQEGGGRQRGESSEKRRRTHATTEGRLWKDWWSLKQWTMKRK